FRRHSWLLLYLFGASPAVCSSFVAGRDHELTELTRGTHYAPYATSLRMGRLGYQSDAQASLCVSYNNLRDYTASLYVTLTVPYAPYEKIGLREDDDYRQLNTTLLQIENEFYSSIRPKRRIKRGERPLHALRERGVEYVEVRLMDLDPFSPIGITPQTCRFLDIFLLHCLVSASPPDTPEEIGEVRRNQQAVAVRGREPGLVLQRGGKSAHLVDWAREVLATCEAIPGMLDKVFGGAAYQDAYEAVRKLVTDAEQTPS